MINSVSVYDLSDAQDIILGKKEKNYNAWITALDKVDKEIGYRLHLLNDSRGIPHLNVYFQDLYEENGGWYEEVAKDLGPQQKDIDKIIKFLTSLSKSSKIINLGVNCFAGISRSSAIALLAWTIEGKTPSQAIQLVIKSRPIAWPNMRILRLAKKHIGKDLYNFVTDWKEQHKEDIYVPAWEY